MTTKTYTFTNSTLMTGSSDVFRTALGGSWRSVTSEDDSSFVELEASQFDATDLPNSFIDKIEYNAALIENTSDTVVNPSKRVPIRIFGTSGSVKNSKHWEAIFLGGTFGGETIDPIFSEDVFEKTYFEYEIPYTKREEKEMSDLGLSSIQISYEYNSYLPPYEDWVKVQSSELLIPNYYLLTDLQDRDLSEGSSDLDLYDSQIISYATREGQYEGVDALYRLNRGALLQIGFDQAEADTDQLQEKNKRYTNLTTTYLTPTLQRYPLSSSTAQHIENKMKNIYLDAGAISRLYGEKRAESAWSRQKFPFYIKIDFPLNADLQIGIPTMLEDENYSARFLKVLKETFMGEIDIEAVKADSKPFNIMSQHKQLSDEITEDISTVNENDYNAVNFESMLFYMYNNYKSVSNDGLFIGANDISRQACFDTTGSYRHFNSMAAAGMIGRFYDALKAVNNAYTIFGGPLNEIYGSAAKSLNTTLAYRVQKVGGTPSGDSRAQNTLQNYWFMNTDSMEDFTLIDTQVKYGTDYTYNVYAYVLTMGRRYKLSNLLLTHQMSAEDTDGDGAIDKWGVEFYDPSTGDVADQIYYVSGSSTDGATDPDPVDNEFATGAHSWVSAPYVADAYLEYEFYPLIVEVPITSKTLKILDNPANATNVFPYQHSNASNKIGFGLYYDTFSQKSVPEALSSTDISLRAAYANANDLLEDERLSLESVSRPRFVEIYRIAYKPTSRLDFTNGLISTIDLKISNYKTPENIFTGDIAPHSTYTYTNTFFDEKIRTNQDYYYLFRILNEQRSLAQWSDIYKVNLVDDGGFVYSLFDTFFESDLEENTFVTPSKDIKKLIHLQPSEWHMDLNTATADFNETAQSQLGNVFAGSADDLIWGKTFKVRLTSKKTGKKIDLNITYNLNRE